jgi:hypothetical protein
MNANGMGARVMNTSASREAGHLHRLRPRRRSEFPDDAVVEIYGTLCHTPRSDANTAAQKPIEYA